MNQTDKNWLSGSTKRFRIGSRRLPRLQRRITLRSRGGRSLRHGNSSDDIPRTHGDFLHCFASSGAVSLESP